MSLMESFQPLAVILFACLSTQSNDVPFTKCYQPDVHANTTCPLGASCWNGIQSEWLVVISRDNICSNCSVSQLLPFFVPSVSATTLKFSKDESFPHHLSLFRVDSESMFDSCSVKPEQKVGHLNTSVSYLIVLVGELDIGVNYFVAVGETNTTCGNGTRLRVFVGKNNCSDTNDDSLVCSNRAPCVFNDERVEFACQCAGSYKGEWCQDINECYNNSQCQHGGRCVDGECSFECECVDGRSGVFCECESSPCQNGGICYIYKQTPEISRYGCQCARGYTGLHCETELNECLSSPCQNDGTCQDLAGQYFCACSSWFTGSDCNEDIDECTGREVCAGAFCNNTFGGYRCIDTIGICPSANCNDRGECWILDLDGGRESCSCGRGFTGSKCQYQLDNGTCLSNPCMNNGTCQYENHDYVCECPSGYGGDYCQFDIDECLSNPCLTGQEHCRDLADGFECIRVCGPCARPPSLCRSSPNVCDQVTCSPGSVCTVEDGIPFCQCLQTCQDAYVANISLGMSVSKVDLSVCLCLSIFLSVCVSVCHSVCLSCLSAILMIFCIIKTFNILFIDGYYYLYVKLAIVIGRVPVQI